MTKNSKPANKKIPLLNLNDGQEFTQFQEKLLQLKNFYANGSTSVEKNSPKKVVSPSKPETFSSPAPKAEKPELKNDQDVKKLQMEARRKRFEQLKLALDWLVENYPLCFNKENPRPLKKRIEKDIFIDLPEGLSFSKISLREALHYYTSSSQYRQNLIDASHRYNLQGEAGEEITENEKQLAQEQLTIFIAKQKERNQQRKKFTKKPTSQPTTSQKT
jgi:ProP effector